MRSWTAVVVGLVALACASCTGRAGGASERGGATALNVFAASSLTDAFTELGRRFEGSHPGVDVMFNFTASSDLALQIEQGAPAHVFASADDPSMQRVVDAGLVATRPIVFAHNELALIVPPSNPGRVRGLADLGDRDLVVSLCAEECPAGRYARRMLEAAGIDVAPDSLEPEVRAVVTRVAIGEADVGVVYASDVAAARDSVEGIAIPNRYDVIATYPVVVLEGAPREAHAFVDLLVSAPGERVLAKYGFIAR